VFTMVNTVTLKIVNLIYALKVKDLRYINLLWGRCCSSLVSCVVCLFCLSPVSCAQCRSNCVSLEIMASVDTNTLS
jgi:hypothetical protein